MSIKQSFLGGAPAAQIYVDDVFVSYLRSGTGASATVTTGIDLSTKGGLVITKARSAATGWRYTDTARGATYSLDSSSTAAAATEAQGITAFGTTGHTVGTDTDYNNSTGPVTYADYVLRKAPKFFDVVTYTGDGVDGRQLSHSLGIKPGLVIVKNLSTETDWLVWHTLTGTNSDWKNMKLNGADQSWLNAQLENGGNIRVSNTSPFNLTFNKTVDVSYPLLSVNQSGHQYVAYLFAHDTSADGIIQCGSFTTDGSGNTALQNLGWEPQFLMTKVVSTTGNWDMRDSMRGFVNSTTGQRALYPNLSNAESGATDGWQPVATGFEDKYASQGPSRTYIYLAIRRPNKPPTSGTQVHTTVINTTGGGGEVATSGFPVDMLMQTVSNDARTFIVDRLRGGTNLGAATPASKTLLTSSTGAELTDITFGCASNTQFSVHGFTTSGSRSWAFRRAPGVFDVVCYTGTGVAHNESHNLGVVPELMIVKQRSASDGWAVYHKDIGNTYHLILDSTAAKSSAANMWNSTTPTASVFTVGTQSHTNASAPLVAYLFATKPGISKVGSFTHTTGSPTNVDCGFSAGARFVLMKKTNGTDDWLVFDTARGIVAGNDPFLRLNSTAAETTTEDLIDPYSAGFTVAPNKISGDYIYLAFA